MSALFSRKEVKFLIVGAINTAVGYGSYALFIFLGVNYMLSNVFASAIGIVNSYLWNRLFTFKSGNSAAPEFARFVSVYLASLALGAAFLYAMVDRLGFNEYAAGAINLVFVVIISWFGHNYFSFKKEEKNV